VAHLAALEACTWIPTEFCETSSAARYFHADFVAHKEAFIIFSDALLCRFSTVKFLEKTETRRSPKTIKDTNHETISHSARSKSGREGIQHGGDVLQFDVDDIPYFAETTLKVLLTSIFW
jgi:hypothetical protein